MKIEKLYEIIEEIKEWGKLGENWGGEEEPAFDQRTVDNTIFVLENTKDIVEFFTECAVTPLSTFILDWKFKNCRINAEIGSVSMGWYIDFDDDSDFIGRECMPFNENNINLLFNDLKQAANEN